MNKDTCLAIAVPGIFEQVIGGSEYQAHLLAKQARTAGMKVHYIFQDMGVQFRNSLGIELHPLQQVRCRKTFGSPWALYARPLLRLLRSIRPDVVYVRGGYSWAGIAAYYAKKTRCRSIWHVASSADVTPRSVLSLLKQPLNLIERKAIEYAIRHCTHIVSHAQFQADLLKNHYGRVSELILKMQPEPKGPLSKGAPFTVVWVANIKPLKQPDKFVQLAREFSEYKDVRFVMVGRPSGGQYQDNLEAKIEALANLDYVGEQPIEKVNAILAGSHVFVNTSTYEGLPNTFVQSWMRAVPVVCMLLDPDGILKTRRIGYSSGSFEQMVIDVRRLIENPALRDDMGHRAREYALEYHSLEKNMRSLLDLIRS